MTSSGTNPATSELPSPIIQVALNGVWYFGCTSENTLGNIPSREIANARRTIPYVMTRITVVIPRIAPRSMKPATQF